MRLKEEIKKRIEMIERGEVPEGYKKTKVGIIPEDWRVYKIEDCLQRVANSVEVEADREYVQIGIRSHGKGLFYKEPVKGSVLGRKKVYWIEPDCLILNIVFAWEQAVGVTTQSEIGLIGSHRFPMYKSVEGTCLTDYMKYYFLTEKGKGILEDASPGGAGRNRTLGKERFMKSSVVLPPLVEQNKIVSILESNLRKIYLSEQLLMQKEQQKKWLMQNLLTGKKRLIGTNKWKRVELGKVLVESEEKSSKNNEYPLLTSSRRGIFLQEDYFKKQVASKNNVGYRIIEKGQFTYRTMSDDGRYTFNKLEQYSKGIVSPSYAVFDVRPSYADSDFIYYFLNDNSFTRYLRSIQQGGTRQALSLTKLSHVNVKLPSLPEQQAIAKILTQADKEIQLLQQKLDLMKQEKKAIMQLLLTGIVRVK